MPFYREQAQKYIKKKPFNAHRFYKGEQEELPFLSPPIGTCGYSKEGLCYLKQFVLRDVVITVRICEEPNGALKTEHTVQKRLMPNIKHGVRIYNTSTDLDIRVATGRFMAHKSGGITKLYPSETFYTENQTDTKFLTKSALIGAIAGSATFSVALLWMWRAIMYYYNREVVGGKKQIKFIPISRTPFISLDSNKVFVSRSGSYYGFDFTLQRGEQGRTEICYR